MNTDFMERLGEEMKEKGGLSDASVKIHLRNLRKINNDKQYNNLRFLHNGKDIIDKIEGTHNNKNTQKSYLSSIIASLKSSSMNHKIPKKTIKMYDDKLQELINEYKNRDKNDKNDKEKNNWISQDEINTLKNEYLEKVSGYIEEGKPLTQSRWREATKMLLLSLYTDIPPRRNQDYQLMKVRNTPFKSKKKNDDDEGSNNYLELNNEKMVFNKYKTSRSSGKQETDFSQNDDFKKVLDLYLQLHPHKNSKEYYLLIDKNGEPLTKINSITRLLNSTFKKQIGSSMLRKLYLTYKFGDDLERLKEMNKIAKQMGHSIGTASNVYIKDD